MTRSERIEAAARALSERVRRDSDSCEWLQGLNDALRAALSLPPEPDRYAEGWRACRIAAEAAAEAEEELDGPIPDAMVAAVRERPADVLRATVRTTKHGIIDRIRALAAPPSATGAPLAGEESGR